MAAEPQEEPRYDLQRPLYLRLPVVALFVVLSAALAAFLISWGTAGDTDDQARDRASDVAAPAAEVEEVSGGTREDCPEADEDVDIAAATAVRDFMATASGLPLGDLRVSPEVAEQLEVVSDEAAVDRMTRIEGYAVNADQVATCTVSTWWDGAAYQKSLDLVVLEPVEVDGGEDAYSISTWVQGEPEPLGVSTVAPLAFLEEGRTCVEPDQISSVPIQLGTPSDQIRYAIEELASGTATRTLGSESMVSPDVQVVSVEVEGNAATVSVTGTDEDMLRCEGRAGFDQIERTVSETLKATLPEPDPAESQGDNRSRAPTEVEVEVTVLVDGQEASTIRR